MMVGEEVVHLLASLVEVGVGLEHQEVGEVVGVHLPSKVEVPVEHLLRGAEVVLLGMEVEGVLTQSLLKVVVVVAERSLWLVVVEVVHLLVAHCLLLEEEEEGHLKFKIIYI